MVRPLSVFPQYDRPGRGTDRKQATVGGRLVALLARHCWRYCLNTLHLSLPRAIRRRRRPAAAAAAAAADSAPAARRLLV